MDRQCNKCSTENDMAYAAGILRGALIAKAICNNAKTQEEVSSMLDIMVRDIQIDMSMMGGSDSIGNA